MKCDKLRPDPEDKPRKKLEEVPFKQVRPAKSHTILACLGRAKVMRMRCASGAPSTSASPSLPSLVCFTHLLMLLWQW